MEQMTGKEILKATGGSLLCGDPDFPIDHVSIDSRAMKGNDLFVPLIGEKVDAHRFISQAVENGAKAVLTSQRGSMDARVPCIYVEDTKKALQSIGGFYRNRLTLPLVGITGSVGKTTTREMVAAALSARFRVFKTPGNYNSQVGLPITITEISQRDEIGVIELGMSEPGELTIIAQIAKLQMAVITNIGVAHIEQLGSRENICREKLTIQDGLMEGGTLFLNGDDEFLKHTRAKEGCKTIYYGTGENSDYRAEGIIMKEGYPSFAAVHGRERVMVRLPVMGSHNIGNAMVSLAVAREWGIPMEVAAKSLMEFTGFQGRQEIYHKAGKTIIDDTYNASPVSMKAALEVLEAMTGKRRIAVLADMKELGEDALRYHYEVGEYLACHAVEELVTYGELAKEISRAVKTLAPEIKVREFMDKEKLTAYLKEEVKEGDCILLKGSNSMKLTEVAARFL